MRPSWQQRAPQTDLEDDGCFFFLSFFFLLGVLIFDSQKGRKGGVGVMQVREAGAFFCINIWILFSYPCSTSNNCWVKKKKTVLGQKGTDSHLGEFDTFFVAQHFKNGVVLYKKKNPTTNWVKLTQIVDGPVLSLLFDTAVS